MKDGIIEAAFIGRVGREPILRESKLGKAWATFSVAVGESDEVQWAQVATIGAKAEELVGSLKKGDRIYVEGRLRLNTWVAKDGTPQSGLSVAASKVEPLELIGMRRPNAKRKGVARKSDVYAPLDERSHGHH
jgi:single-strand DNA-binding protein